MRRFHHLMCCISLTLALVLGALDAAQAQTQLIQNGGFETGDLAGWTVVSSADSANPGSFYVGNNTLDTNLFPASPSTPLQEFPSVGAAAGNFYAVSDASGPGAHALLQNFTVLPNTHLLKLSFSLFVNDWNGAGALNTGATLDPNQRDGQGNLIPTQFARVDILTGTASALSTSSSDLVDTLYLGEDSSSTLPNPYTFYTFDLSSVLKPGQSYWLRFAEVDNQFPLNVGVDNVSLTDSTLVPEGGSWSLLCAGLVQLGLAAGWARKQRLRAA